MCIVTAEQRRNAPKMGFPGRAVSFFPHSALLGAQIAAAMLASRALNVKKIQNSKYKGISRTVH